VVVCTRVLYCTSYTYNPALVLQTDTAWDAMVRTLDLRSRGREFDSRSGRYQVITTWMGDCLWTGKPSRYITNHEDLEAFHHSGVSKSSTVLFGCMGYKAGRVHPCRAADNTVCVPIWQVTLRSFEMGYH